MGLDLFLQIINAKILEIFRSVLIFKDFQGFLEVRAPSFPKGINNYIIFIDQSMLF